MAPAFTRREALGSAGLALATAVAGCGWDTSGGEDATSTSTEAATDATETAVSIPGIEEGAVADSRELALAHEDVLRTRSGRIVGTEVEIDRSTGEAVRSGAIRTDIDGDWIRSVAVRTHPAMPPERVLYTEGEEFYRRVRVDGEWEASRFDPASSALAVADLTGRSRISTLVSGMRVVGPDPEVEDRYLLRETEAGAVDPDEETDVQYREHVVVDTHGLCHEWDRTILDRDVEPARWIHSGRRLEGLLETSVSRPDWVDDIEE